MPVDDLGDYDVQPVDHNPFGSMADSSQNYDVQGVDHNPFAAQPFAGPAPVPDAPPPMTSADITARGGFGTLKAADTPAPTEWLRGHIQQGLEGMGMSTGNAQDISQNAKDIYTNVPGLGQVSSGADAAYDLYHGNYLGAGLNAVGAIPDVGTAAHGVGAMFLGPLARNVDREAMGAAKTALQAGEHQYDVWGQHLWEPDAAGNWRTEIADPGAPDIQKWGNPGESGVLSNYYDHPELYGNYPDLANAPVRFAHPDDMQGAVGGYHSPSRSFIFNSAAQPHEVNEVLPHEVQHAVAHIEGWPPGTNPWEQRITPGSPAQKAFLSIPTKDRKAMGREEVNRQSQGMAYLANTGEVSAFNTGANRLGYDMDWRRANPPPTTEHVDRGFQWWGGPGDYHWGQDIEPRASGGSVVDDNEALRRRLALLMQPRHGFADGGAPDDQPAQSPGFAALDKMTADYRANQPPDQPQPEPEPAPPVYGGKYGQAAEDAYQTGMGYVGQGMDWLGNKFEQGVGTTAASLGIPAANQLARDARAMVFESGELGPKEEPRPNVARYNHPSFPEGRIATRVPTSVALADAAHQTNDAKIGLDTMQGVPAFFDKTAAKAREMPYEPGPVVNNKPTWTPTAGLNIPADATPEQVHGHLVDHFTSNILALHDAVDPDIQPGSQKWYEGANTRAIQLAQRYGKPLENIAGAFAAMSPKMDWFQNVSLSERLMDIVHNQGDTAFTPEMRDWVNSRYGKAKAPADLKAQGIFNRISGSTFNQLTDPLDKAHWVRAYDQAHNPRDYNIVNPDGSFAGAATNVDGTNAKAAWGNGYEPIAKAIRAFTANDMPSISAAMGDAHKVRSFYNNIVAPWSDHGDVTVDTHAIAAALLRPLAGDDKDVVNGLGMGGPDHAATGMHGLYGAYVEAYRKAAQARGILPRQMQSITWEALRGLWSPEQKASEAVNASVRNVWQRFKNGEIDLPTAQRELIYDPDTGLSRIQPPDWHTAGWRP